MGQVVRLVTIAAGASDSEAVFAEQYKLAAVYMPAAWDTAQLTVRGSFVEGGVFIPCYDKNGSEYVIIVAANRYVNLPAWIDLAGLRHFKIRSGTNDVPVNQSSARTLRLLLSH